MLEIIQGVQYGNGDDIFEQMFKARALVFHDRLKWEVKVDENGFEKDQFDTEDTVYLISRNPDTGVYWGSLRIMPTTGPNMLRDIFPFLMGDQPVPSADDMWEVSRINVVVSEGQFRNKKLNLALYDLLSGFRQPSLRYGINNYVSVFDAPRLRLFRSSGTTPEIIGVPQNIGETRCYVGMFKACAEAYVRIDEAFAL